MIARLQLLVLGLVVLVCSCQGPGARPAGGEAEPLRVLSYNIHHGEGLDGALDLPRLAEIVRRSSADLVALQEVDRGALRTDRVDQVRRLGELTGFEPAFAKFMDFQGGRYGLAVLSRYPIERSWPIPLPEGTHEPRSALAVRVTTPQLGPLTFVCLHFDWLADDERRFAQARALLEALAQVEGPVILAGDFNDVPESRTLQLFEAAFANAAKPAGARATFPSNAPEREIDFVRFRTSAGWTGSSRTLHEPLASDHSPLLATLRLR